MLDNLTIKARLIIAFGALTMLLLVTNLLALQRMGDAMEDMNLLIDDRVAKVRLVAALTEGILNNGRNLRGMLLVDSAAERQALKTELAESRKQNGEFMAKLDALVRTEGGRQVFNKIKEAREQQQGLYAHYFELLEKSPADAKQFLLKDFSVRNNALVAALKEMSVRQDDSMKQDVQRNRDEYASARTRGIAALVAGLLIAVGAALWILRSVTGPLNGMRDVMMQVRDRNDFTATVSVSGNNEVAQTALAFNDLLLTLRKTLGDLKQSIGQVDGSAQDLETAAKQSAQASALSSESAAAMAASVEEVSVSINQVSENAHSASELAKQAGQLSEEGGKVISDAADEIRHIAEGIDRVAGVMTTLGEQSQEISSIVQVIKDVADQTNLLALNAAIEAARAGEAGRGFAVVADEVRKLAERTTKATSDISGLIGNIQASSQSAVGAMRETVEQVKSGCELAEQAGKSIVEIRQAAGEVVHVVADIASSIAEQSTASQSLAQQLEQVAQAAEENSAVAAETAESAHRLGELALAMRTNTDRFKI